MIMAGRGRLLRDLGGETKKVGVSQKASEDLPIDIHTLVNEIDEFNSEEINLVALSRIRNLFTMLSKTREGMKDVLSELHCKALCDISFGEKFIMAMEEVSDSEINGLHVRSELLQLFQKDFELKDTLSQSDPIKFLNAVMLLGVAYDRLKVCGKPIQVLGGALLQYFDMLIMGEEGELKILICQILMNGSKLSDSKELLEKFELLKQNLRNALITRELSLLCRCWILLAIDIISSRSLTGGIRNFYVTHLGEEFIQIESHFQAPKSDLNTSLDSAESTKSQNILISDKKLNHSQSNTEEGIKNFSKKFFGMSIKLEEGGFKGKKEKQVLSQDKKTKGETWKSVKGSLTSGHDDRFEKDENFYGVQMPRQPKPENQRKYNCEGKSKESDEKTKSPKGREQFCGANSQNGEPSQANSRSG